MFFFARKLAALAFVSTLSTMVAGPPAASFLPFPGGVASPESNIAFVRRADAGIDAIRLDSGAVEHHWPVQGRPAGMHDGNLIVVAAGATRNELLALAYGPGAGATAKTIAVRLPQAVNTADLGFVHRLELAGDVLTIEWRFRTRYSGGAPAQAAIARLYENDLSGVQTVDLRSGVVTAAAAPATPALPRVDRPFAYQREWPSWTTAPWLYHGLSAWLRATPAGKEQAISLEIESAARRRAYPLIASAQPFAFVSLDGGHVLMLNSPPERAQPWLVFAVESGKLLGQAEFTKGARDPEVLGQRIYFLSAAPAGPAQEKVTLRAADLVSGRALWETALGTRAAVVSSSRPQ